MSRISVFLWVAILAIAIPVVGVGVCGAATVHTTLYYGDITLPDGGGFFWQPGIWDLNCEDAVISYTLDLTGAPNVPYTGNYGHAGYVGLVWPGDPWAGAWMSGFLCDWDNPNDLFPIFPDKDDTQDMDDKFNMQRSPGPGSWDELMYDVVCGDPPTVYDPAIGSYDNYGIWFDRDGVDPWQANMWGMVDGGTYNTYGLYEVQLTYSKYSATKGIACPLFFPNLENPDVPGGYGVPTGFNRVSPEGYQYVPAGISFDTDEGKMGGMQVFASGNSDGGIIVVRDLTITGCLYLESGMATGGGWFIPEEEVSVGLIIPGGKATFGFVAKQKNETSSGQLEFQYHADGLNLKSAGFDWVRVPAPQVMFEGVGTLNDQGAYKFRVWAFDADKTGTDRDRFTIRIWTGNDNYELPTYRAEGDLCGGNIVVHKK